jgi:hypothetical protein
MPWRSTTLRAPRRDLGAGGPAGSVGHLARRTDDAKIAGEARPTILTTVSRIFTISVASVYPHYVTKVEKKGRTKDELNQVIEWLTGFDESALNAHLEAGTTFEDFFAAANLNPQASSITGSICGVRVQDIEDPLMQQIRYLDKLVDELAKGKAMEKVLRA